MGKRVASFDASDNSSGNERPAKTAKKSKNEAKKGSSSKKGANVDSEGNAFWDLSGKRRIVIQEFKGSWFVNLREYYEDKSTGEMKPGKKGIMLTVDQFQTLVGSLPAITTELRKHGVKIAGGGAAENPAAEDDEDDEDNEMPAKPAKKSSSKSKKANIEATSDEAED